MEINRTKKLNNLQFYPAALKKTMIFWHHTAGMTAEGAINWWNQTPEKVGTAYVIDRDGTIYEVFDPSLWAYHAGVKGDDDFIEKNAIGIELVAAGAVQLVEGKFMFYPLWPKTIGGKVIPKEDVWDMGEAGWKGNRYYHKYTDKQIQSLIELTQKLMRDFGITAQIGFEDFKWVEYNEEITIKHPSGIWSHTSVRKDKNDIVPYKSFLDSLKGKFITQSSNNENKSKK